MPFKRTKIKVNKISDVWDTNNENKIKKEKEKEIKESDDCRFDETTSRIIVDWLIWPIVTNIKFPLFLEIWDNSGYIGIYYLYYT